MTLMILNAVCYVCDLSNKSCMVHCSHCSKCHGKCFHLQLGTNGSFQEDDVFKQWESTDRTRLNTHFR